MEGLRSLQLGVPADSLARDSVFYLGLVFGDFFSGTVYQIETKGIMTPGANGTHESAFTLKEVSRSCRDGR